MHLMNLRIKKGFSQQQLADQLGVSRVTISNLERGVYKPSLKLAFKIANYFKEPIQNIFPL